MASNWLPQAVVTDTLAVSRVFYIDRRMAGRWNAQRGEEELRLLTGWAWASKDGKHQRQGFKTQAVCLRDAWYELVSEQAAPVYKKRVFRGTIRLADLEPAVAA